MLKKILIAFVLLSIITVGIFIVTNPLEKLREGRDTQRVDDLTRLKKAIDFYVTHNAKEIAASSGLLCTVCKSNEEIFSFRKISVNNLTTIERSKLYVNGTGWVPLDFSLNVQFGETPLHLLPIDPLEQGYPVRTKLNLSKTEDFVYTYTAGANGKYKLTAKMESKKGLEKAKNDGGTVSDRLEIGTDLTLKP